MKIQASNIQKGDRIYAYFNNKMQVCTVKYISNDGLPNIRLNDLEFEWDKYAKAQAKILSKIV